MHSQKRITRIKKQIGGVHTTKIYNHNVIVTIRGTINLGDDRVRPNIWSTVFRRLKDVRDFFRSF